MILIIYSSENDIISIIIYHFNKLKKEKEKVV